MSSEVISALLGGVVIGLAITLLRVTEGKIVGVSGMLGGALLTHSEGRHTRLAFLGGLALGGALLAATSKLGPVDINHHRVTLLASGLLVGFGTRLGHGCTSGHGICGVGRGSPRSLVATASFMAAGFVVVALVRHVW